MKISRIVAIIMLIGVGFEIMRPPILAQERDAPQLVLIGHASVSETLTPEEIKQIFLGRLTRKDGQALTFVIFKDDAVYAVFLKQYVGKTIAQYTNYWKKQVFTGKGRMPKMFQDPDELLAYVASNEGTISYLPQETAVSDTPVHAISITE